MALFSNSFSRRQRIKNSYTLKIALLLPLVLVLILSSFYLMSNINVEKVEADFDGGDGDTEETAYIINSYAQWIEMLTLEGEVETSGNYYELGSDIVIQEDYDPSNFTGTLDGKNHKITNLKKNLFDDLDEATIKNLIIENADYQIADAEEYVGILGRYATNSDIENVSVSGSIVSTSDDYCDYFGGIVGNLDSSSISNSSSNVDMDLSICEGTYVGGLVGGMPGSSIISNSFSSGSINASQYVGGLAGFVTTESSIEQSYSTVDVTSDDQLVGGLVGSNGGLIENTYATGNVVADSFVGGLAGMNDGEIYYSYATGDVESFGTEESTGGLVGYNGGFTVYSSFSVGVVTAELFELDSVGGFIGNDWNSHYNSGWWTGSYEVAIGTGSKPIDWSVDDPDDFKNEEFGLYLASSDEDGHEYEPWDFENIWTTNGGTTYPVFLWSESEEDEESDDSDDSSSLPKSTSFALSSPPGCGSPMPVGAPNLFQIDRVSAGSVVLNFTAVIDNTKNYHIIYGYSRGDYRFGILNVGIEASGVQQITINDLEANIPYYFVVAPVNNCAVGAWSDWMMVGGSVGTYYN